MTPGTFKYTWDKMGRQGQKCEIISASSVRGRFIQVRFEDGFTAVVDRRALRAEKKSGQKEPVKE